MYKLVKLVVLRLLCLFAFWILSQSNLFTLQFIHICEMSKCVIWHMNYDICTDLSVAVWLEDYSLMSIDKSMFPIEAFKNIEWWQIKFIVTLIDVILVRSNTKPIILLIFCTANFSYPSITTLSCDLNLSICDQWSLLSFYKNGSDCMIQNKYSLSHFNIIKI